VRSNLWALGVVTALCFASCKDDDRGDDDAAGGQSGEGANAGETGDAGQSTGGRGGATGGTGTGGRATGGTATGGTATGGTATGGAGGNAGTEGGAGGEGGAAEPGGAGGEGGAACTPTDPPDEVCDDVDNDCNGDVDDIDVGNDGIRDCLEIVLIGAPGALSSSNFQLWLEEQGTTVSRIHESGTPAALTGAELIGFDVAILDNLVREYTPAESQALAAWVRTGGGLMSLNGHTGGSDLTRGNSLLVELGVEHLSGLRSGNITTFRSHPLTTGLTSVTFSGGYRLGNLPSGEGSSVVAETTDGPVGLELERGLGRAFVWGDEWVEFDSEWQSLPAIKRFWINSLGWLSGAL